MVKWIPTWALRLLTRRNYKLREIGKGVDLWYWADVELFERGKLME